MVDGTLGTANASMYLMITIIVVNYNSASHTIELLRSLERQSDPEYTVIVVDNDSQPTDREQLGAYAATTPLHLDIIYSSTNRGFSGGNNLGIRKALAQKSEWVVLLNPDTTVKEHFVSGIKAFTSCREGIVAIPTQEPNEIAYCGSVRWFRTTLPHISDQDRIRHTHWYAIGAGMAIHHSVFEQIGLWDERYFLYFEDADFSMRARHAGIPLEIAPILITHAVSQSTHTLGSPLLLRYHMRNTLLFNWKNGPWWVRLALPIWSIYGIMKSLTKIVLMPSRRMPSKAIAAGIIDFYAKRYGIISPSHHHRN